MSEPPQRTRPPPPAIPPEVLRRKPWLTYILIGLCVLWTLPVFLGWWDHVDAGAVVERYLWQGEWWRLLSAMLLHGTGAHLAVNCVSLYFVGRAIELGLRWKILLFFFLATGMSAWAASLVLTVAPPGTTLVRMGFSGAIAGGVGVVLAVEWIVAPSLAAFFRSRNVIVVLVLIVANAWLGASIPGVDNAAHAGGFAAGLVLGLALFGRDRRLHLGRTAVATLLVTVLPLAYALHPVYDADYCAYRAFTAESRDDLDAALRLYERALRLDEERREVRAGLYRVLARLADRRYEADPASARELARRALDLGLRDDAVPGAWFSLGRKALAAGDRDLAYAALQESASLLPEREQWRPALLLLSLVDERLRAATLPGERVDRAVELTQAARRAARGLGSEEPPEGLLQQVYRAAEQARLVARAVSGTGDPNLAVLHANLGWLYQAVGNNVEDGDPRLPRILFHSAASLWEAREAGVAPADADRELILSRMASARREARRRGDGETARRVAEWARREGVLLPE